jgi:predicted negative regulator of RcsB-dependent stress response
LEEKGGGGGFWIRRPDATRLLPDSGKEIVMKTGLIVLAVIVVGLGFYLGWFHVSSHSNAAKSNVTFSVDKNKIEADKDQAVDKVQDLGHTAEAKIAATTQKATD